MKIKMFMNLCHTINIKMKAIADYVMSDKFNIVMYICVIYIWVVLIAQIIRWIYL